jgi:hypothetical protein
LLFALRHRPAVTQRVRSASRIIGPESNGTNSESANVERVEERAIKLSTRAGIRTWSSRVPGARE